MRPIIFLFFFVTATTSLSAQKSKNNYSDSLSYEMTQNLEIANSFKDGTRFNKYLCKDGQVIKVGDKLKIGPPSGAKVTVGNNENVSAEGQPYVHLLFTTLNPAYFSDVKRGANLLNEEDIVRTIYVMHNGKKNNSLVTVCIQMENPNMKKFMGANMRYVTDIDRALESGEIMSLNKKIYNKDKAIARLKELKELLELGVITKEDYEKEKNELSTIILRN